MNVFNKGIPMVPFPTIEKCLGLSSKDSSMQIKEGYAIMGYDFDVSKSDSDCLFNMKETLKEKELRAANEAKS